MSEKTFKLGTYKQKLFTYEFNYFNLDEKKIKKNSNIQTLRPSSSKQLYF